MAVPDFQTLMRPLLDQYATGTERSISDVRSALATASPSRMKSGRSAIQRLGENI